MATVEISEEIYHKVKGEIEAWNAIFDNCKDMPRTPRRRAIFHCTGETKTQQHFRDECDVNTVLRKYRQTGFASHVSLKRQVYDDFSSLEDYHTSVENLRNAQELFTQLPARVRARVDNDPGKLIAFVADPANDDELVELGLKEKPKDPEPDPEPAGEEPAGGSGGA